MPRARVTISFEYDIDPCNYPEDMSLEGMIDYDVSGDENILIETLAESDITILKKEVVTDGQDERGDSQEASG